VITWPLSGNFPGTEIPIGPPLLNHGFQYYDGYPALITIIDIGQQIFMFILGYVAYIAFTSRMKKRGAGAAWKHGIIRVAVLYGLAFLDDGLIGGLLFGDGIPWDEVLWYGTHLLAYLIPKSADKRLYVCIGIMIIHAILYATPLLYSTQRHYLNIRGLEELEPFHFRLIR